MPIKMSYAIEAIPGMKRPVVEGLQIDENFACRKGKLGWEITHLPTGYLVTSMRFHSFEDCQVFTTLLKIQTMEAWGMSHIRQLKSAIPDKLAKVIKLLDQVAQREPIFTSNKFTDLERALNG